MLDSRERVKENSADTISAESTRGDCAQIRGVLFSLKNNDFFD